METAQFLFRKLIISSIGFKSQWYGRSHDSKNLLPENFCPQYKRAAVCTFSVCRGHILLIPDEWQFYYFGATLCLPR
jgi:hypothetical protein